MRLSLLALALAASCGASGCDSPEPVAARKASSADGSCGDARQAGAVAPCDRGKKLKECFDAPETDAGIATCLAVGRQLPDDGTWQAPVRIELADIALAREREAEAIAHVEAAMALDPDNAYAWLKRADIHDAHKRYEAAHADLEHALDLGPDDGYVLYKFARSLNGLNRNEDALVAINRALPRLRNERRELMAVAFGRRCRIRADLGIELDAALDDCAVSESVPDAVSPNVAHLRRALVYFRLGRFTEALAQIEQAKWTGKDRAYPLYMRGLTRRAMGQHDAGKADLDEAVRLDPQVVEDLAEYR